MSNAPAIPWFAELRRWTAWIALGLTVSFATGAEQKQSSQATAQTKAKGKADWWSFRPANRPVVPPVASPGSTNPIDRFIRAKLAELKITPSPEADPVTLIRRLSYDLIGLPPTPEEVDAFLAECQPLDRSALRVPSSALERLVDRLLASPRHGERWARHWLDVVHYGETHGYDKDKLRAHAWPYRDYVIRAFNEDKPWSRFIEEQLAGDVLYPDEPEGVVALGFIAAGPWDFVGHVELPESKTDGLIARYNDRDDMVMTTFSSFQSLTVHCARCHDHKFDPISQRDYYALQAVFAGVDRANRPYDPDPKVHQERRRLMTEKKSLEERRQEFQRKMKSLNSPALTGLDQRISALGTQLEESPSPAAPGKSPSNGYHSGIESKPNVPKWVQVDLGREVTIDEIRLVAARPTDFPDTPGFGFPTRFKVEVAGNDGFGAGTVVADHSATDFKNPGDTPVVFTLGPPKKEDAGPVRARFVRLTASRLWERTRDYVFALGELQLFADGTNLASQAKVTALDSIEAGRWSTKYLVDGFSSRGPLSDSAPTPERLARRRELEADLKRVAAERERVFDSLVPSKLKDELAAVEKRQMELSKALASLPEARLVYAAANDFKAEGSFNPPKGMRPVHLLPRGDVKRPQEIMQPAALACVPGPDSVFSLSTNHQEGSRRAALARWLTDPRNHQTRRSIVNRVWQYHFGRGLVDSANDFGHMGGEPTHPELLDWLAYWFLDQGESLKKLHRLIVTSATYRQMSDRSPEETARRDATTAEGLNRARAADADNRYLWRMNRARLDAECVRDAMLQISGQLDLTMGGPSDRQFHFKDDHSPVYDYSRFDVDKKEGRRRSIYRHIVRSVTDPFMDCLDSADPSQLVAHRNTTLTALQALSMLNDQMVLRQCEHFAERLQKLTPEVPRQIETAYRLALSRLPTRDEQDRFTAYVQKHGLANMCRILFNSSEFMFVD